MREKLRSGETRIVPAIVADLTLEGGTSCGTLGSQAVFIQTLAPTTTSNSG
jgi:hypothetical protein